MTKFRIQLGLIILLVIFALSLLISMGASSDMPPFFALKRVQENIFLKFKSNPRDKVNYMIGMLDSRLEELGNVVKNKNYGYVLKAASRYSTLAGQITDLVTGNNMTDKVDVVRNQFLNHQKALDQLYVIYPKNIPENEEWKFILDDFNYLKLYLDKLEKVK